jgi:hypothetical protein
MVAVYPDQYEPTEPSGEVEVATAPALPRGARVLTTLPLDEAGARVGLLAPLAAQGSVVYSAPANDLAAIAATERATHTAGVDVPGLPRLR